MLTNDQNIKNLKTRKILRYVIIVCCIITIVLSILCLIFQFSFLIPLVAFIITSYLSKKRESIPINKSKELLEIEKELKEHKKKGKKI